MLRKILVTLWICLYCLCAHALPFNQIVFFGDSLTDNGNLHRLMGIPHSPPYYQGRFSNGPTWADLVGTYYHDRFLTDYTVKAYGGATALPRRIVHKKFIAPVILQDELNAYYENPKFKEISKILHVFWIGSNDYLYDTKTDIDQLSSDVVNHIISTIDKLISKKAQYFLILNVPDLSRTPLVRNAGLGNRENEIARLSNLKLNISLNQIQHDHPAVKITLLDTFEILEDLVADPEKYNQKYNAHIVNTTEPCWTGLFAFNTIRDDISNSAAIAEAYKVDQAEKAGVVPCDKPDEYIFWDELHPTAIIHKILAEIVEQKINDEYPV